MKKIISLLAAASMSALALVSCIKEDVKTTGETFTVNFLAQTPETKTIFGTPEGTTVPTLWEEGDNIAVICNFANDKKTSITTTDGKSASFSAEFPSIKEAESYTFYAAYPYVTSPYKSGKVKVSIPAVQTPVEGNIAKDAMGLVAKSEAFTAKPTEPVTLSFKHAAAYGCITKLDGVPAEVNISSIKISSDNNIVGTFLSDCESTTLTEDSASSILTINTNAHNNIWFSVAPFEGGNVKFEVITDDGTYVVEKDFAGKKFEAGKIARFGITGFTKSGAADVVYTLVKSVDELVEGANVIIAVPGSESEVSTTALGTTQNKSNRNAVSVTLNTEKNIINPDQTVEVLTIGKGLNGDTYSLYANTTAGYLYAAGDQNPTKSQNYLKTEETLSINSSWTISITTEGVATIKTAGTAQSHTLKKNSNSALYACYTGGQTNVAIYIDQTSVLPALKAPEVIAIKNGTTIDVAWQDVENATEYVVSCNGQADQTVNTGVEEASFTNLSDGDYVVTVTAKADGFKSATGSAESIHIGLLARELAFETASVTVAPGELFSNTLTGKKIDDVVYTITNKDGSAVDENAVTIDANDGSGLAGDVEGEYIVKATAEATEEYAAGEASYTLKVAADTTPGTGDGTKASPYSADRVFAKVSALSSTETLPDIYVSGKISKIDTYNDKYGSITYYISEDGTTTANQFMIYGGLSFNKEKFAALTDLTVGDEVVVFGTAKNYNGTTPELDVNSELISLNGKVALKNRNLAYTPSTATITVGDVWTAPELTGDLTGATVSYSSDNTVLATVAADGTISLVADATGTATITASVVEDETYAEASATYTITVKEASQGGEIKSFSQTYVYGLSDWSLTNYEDVSSYYKVPSSSDPSVATIASIFTNKNIQSDVVITLNVATFGSGTNPSASTFSIFADSDCTTLVDATQGGTLPTDKNYKDVTYTITKDNATAFVKDLVIKITKPGKQIRLKSITVTFTYSE